jgi:hypothetical protein
VDDQSDRLVAVHVEHRVPVDAGQVGVLQEDCRVLAHLGVLGTKVGVVEVAVIY